MSSDTLLAEFLNDLGKRTAGDLRTDELQPHPLQHRRQHLPGDAPRRPLPQNSRATCRPPWNWPPNTSVPLIARTGGSSLVGQAVGEALIMDFTRHLDHVLEFNEEEQWVRVQPGIVLDALNIYLRPHGLQFGPDPASSNRAAMGGIVSNNSTGAHSILYGMTADHLLEANVLLDDGSSRPFPARCMGGHGANGATELRPLSGQIGPRGRNLPRPERPGQRPRQPADHRRRHAAPVAALRRLQPRPLRRRSRAQLALETRSALQPGPDDLRRGRHAGRHHRPEAEPGAPAPENGAGHRPL